MKLYHVTPAHNMPSIRRLGLLPRFALYGKALVWLCTREQLQWVIPHVKVRHGTDQVSCLYVDLPRRWLTWRADGHWVTDRDIPHERILGQVCGDGVVIG